jgi:hypothetical protein
MKAISARARYNQDVLDRLFSTSERADATVRKVLAARSSASGKFESFGLVFSTNKAASVKKKKA